MKKRMLAMLMAMCLMLTLVPVAFAAETTMDETAFRNAVAAGGTVTLTGDVTLTSSLTINNAVTIDGTSAKYSITAPSNQNAIDARADGVTLNNLQINASGIGYAVNSTGSSLTVSDCAINAVERGINFYPTNGTGATLTVSGTVIKNTAVTDYDTSVNYSGYNRGIATGDVLNGTVTISNSQILGFKYSINPVVTPESDSSLALRDGNGTKFNISGTTIKGWTALNMWSANTEYNFTNCILVGISTLSGDSNGFCTIRANDGIYGGRKDKSSVVKFIGGSATAVRLGEAPQAIFGVDYERQTKYVFEQNDDEELVSVNYYGPENADDSYVRVVVMWNFYPGCDEITADNYLATMVSGTDDNTFLVGGSIAEYRSAVATVATMSEPSMEVNSKLLHIGGAS